MTQRLYYDDAYLTRFTAHVIEQFPYQDQFAVVLDRTAFYPTGGGQPCDQGILGGVPVLDVAAREADGAVLHLLESPLLDSSSHVAGEIDWERRFDHMQQHTGQHILSQVFAQLAQAETVSFHLGTESATIDLAGLPQESASVAKWADQAEAMANRIVWEDRPVTTRIVHTDELPALPLRKPPTVAGDVRVVQVTDFDWSACGGTHVSRSGEVGLIKIIKWERRGDETRVEFRCGQRALDDYGQKNRLVNSLAAGFSVGHWELDQAVERLAAEVKDLRTRLREAGRALAHYAAVELRAAAPEVAGVRVVAHNLAQRPSDEMRELARQLVSEPRVVALLGASDRTPDGASPPGKAQFCFARSPDVEIDLVPLVRDTAGTLGDRRGGGKPDFAQGGGPLTDARQLETALDWATQRLIQQLHQTRRK
jgi:alanyl-tRNA synthetase